MFRILSATSLAAVVLFGSPARSWPLGIRGNGAKVTEARPNLTGFKRIQIDGSTDAVVREGAFGVAVNIDSNLQPYIVTEVRGDTLVITTRESVSYHGVGRAEISMPALEGIAIHGSGDVSVGRMAQRTPLAVEITGSGDVDYRGSPLAVQIAIQGSGDLAAQLDEPVEAIKCEVHGSGDVKLSGRSVGTLSVSLAGSGDFDARALPARDGRFITNSSGDIKSTLTGGSVEFTSHGSGDIDWWGEAQVLHEHQSASGNVHHHT